MTITQANCVVYQSYLARVALWGDLAKSYPKAHKHILWFIIHNIARIIAATVVLLVAVESF